MESKISSRRFSKKTNKWICFFWLEELLCSEVKCLSFVFLENLQRAVLFTILSYLYEVNEINMIFGQNWTISVIVRLRDEKKRARAPEFRAQVDRMAKSGIINPNRLFQEYFGLLNSWNWKWFLSNLDLWNLDFNFGAFYLALLFREGKNHVDFEVVRFSKNFPNLTFKKWFKQKIKTFYHVK